MQSSCENIARRSFEKFEITKNLQKTYELHFHSYMQSDILLESIQNVEYYCGRTLLF